jgi:hypothetical protein
MVTEEYKKLAAQSNMSEFFNKLEENKKIRAELLKKQEEVSKQKDKKINE